FASIDPNTGLPPTDPTVGFLQPGMEGSVLFTVLPKPSVPTGTIVQNQASVVFDFNPAMNTPVWSNTLDNDKPISQVQTLPATHLTPDASTSLVEGNDTLSVADASGTVGLPTTLSAVLLRASDNAPLKGRSLHFFVNNIPVGTADTDSTGTATLNYLVPAFPF